MYVKRIVLLVVLLCVAGYVVQPATVESSLVHATPPLATSADNVGSASHDDETPFPPPPPQQQSGCKIAEAAMPPHSSIVGFTDSKDIEAEAHAEGTAEMRYARFLREKGYPYACAFEWNAFDMSYGVATPDWGRFKKHGHRRKGVRRFIRNQLYALTPADPEVLRLATQLEELDEEQLAHAKANRKLVSRSTKQAMQKGGVGATGRGWGITAAPTNKWRFYHKYVVRARDLRQKAGKYFRMAEVGMLAGQSTTLLMLIATRYSAAASMQVFDFLQPGTSWGKVAEGFLKKKFPGQVDVAWGSSLETVPQYRRRLVEGKNCTKFDFVSLDGDKTLLMNDVYHFKQLSRPDTVLVLDDVNVVEVRAGAPHLASPDALQHIIREGDAQYPKHASHRLRYHIARRELILVECWDPDINSVLYGDCALRYNYSAALSIPPSVLRDTDTSVPGCTE